MSRLKAITAIILLVGTLGAAWGFEGFDYAHKLTIDDLYKEMRETNDHLRNIEMILMDIEAKLTSH